VIHSYTSGWRGSAIIPDKPVKGVERAIALLRSMGYKIIIYSTRCATPQGRKTMKAYLKRWNIKVDGIATEKPGCFCYVDDRAITFSGDWDKTINDITTFRSYIEYNKEKINGKGNSGS